MSDADRPEESAMETLAELGAAALTALRALEVTFRRMGPGSFRGMRTALAPVQERLADALAAAESRALPEGLEPLHAKLRAGAEPAAEALAGVLEPVPEKVLGAMGLFAEAQDELYPLRAVFPPLARFFTEEGAWPRLTELDAEPAEAARVGIHRAGSGGEALGRGGFCFYVPESWDGVRSLPLVVALHGGAGSGPAFLWTWLREARSRGFFLLAPSSQGETWSLMGPDRDSQALRRMIDFLAERWPIDRERVLLTGLSDGATYTLLEGLAEDAPYSHLAPVSGVLHPIVQVNGNLGRAAGRPIYLVHGSLDWMFPIETAREARDLLEAAGAVLVFREIEDLSHAYPREENDAILRWFDPELALPS